MSSKRKPNIDMSKFQNIQTKWIQNPRRITSGLEIRKSLRYIILIGAVFVISIQANAQKKLQASGFLEYLNNTWIPTDDYASYGFNNWQNQSSIYNRINLWYTPTQALEFHVGMRNNFTFGPLVAQYNQLFNLLGNTTYADLITHDDGYLDLTWEISSDQSNVLYTNLDRLYMKWTLERLEITVGRQRINWGTNLVWNPNDIFNAFNYFDFNYIERPGSDAVLLEYYTGDFSSIQLAGKLSYRQVLKDSVNLEEELSLTTAAMFKFNRWGYDFQFFGGLMQTDITAGLGWAGQIGGAGFTGEASWFRDRDNFADTSGIIIASISGNYIFSNQLMLNMSVIYNSNGSTGPAYAEFGNALGSLNTMFSSSLNVKNLTFSRFDIFGQVSYPASPLINVSLSGIFNPYDKSVYVGPSGTFSLTDNISLMLVGQLFFGDALTEFGGYGQMYFIDLKWSF